jgi:hypothetical protein
MKITFEKMERVDATISEQSVIVDGDDIATITVERADANASRFFGVTSAYPKWQAVAYDVEFFVDGFEDRSFAVENFASARAAHTAAKNYIREVVA